jgi:hypothetical protein
MADSDRLEVNSSWLTDVYGPSHYVVISRDKNLSNNVNRVGLNTNFPSVD